MSRGCSLVLFAGLVASCTGDGGSGNAGGTMTSSGGGGGSETPGGTGATPGTGGGDPGGAGMGGAGAPALGGSAGSLGGASTGGAGSAGGAGASGSGGGSSAGGHAGTSDGDIPPGTILFEERFDDADFASRGWYDGPSGAIDTGEHAPGSASSYECAFAVGATSCTDGKPARHALSSTPRVYASFWLKFSSGWVGSGVAYHPHMLHFINDLDDAYVGPAHTYLTTYTEVVNGRALLALQDSKNADLACILQNNDSFVGCNGDFASYVFTEQRSVCACNGLLGDLGGRDCFSNGDGTWYSSRSWSFPDAFTDAPGPSYESDWHFVEVYFEMNSIVGGVGVPDGKIRWVQDGTTLITSDAILMRTADHANLQFNQFAMLPYIGDGSPIAQSFFIDDLVVATGRP